MNEQAVRLFGTSFVTPDATPDYTEGPDAMPYEASRSIQGHLTLCITDRTH